MATGLALVGAVVGCTFASIPSEVYGRRLTVLLNNLFYLIGGILAASGVKDLLFVGRLISGFGLGVTTVVAPVLLSEIADDANRGTITTLHQVGVVVGILFAGVVAYGFVEYVAEGWRFVVVLGGVPGVLMLSKYAHRVHTIHRVHTVHTVYAMPFIIVKRLYCFVVVFGVIIIAHTSSVC